jgi:hypothetical protein
MLPVNPDAGGETPADAAYKLIGAARTTRVTSDNTIQDIVAVTAQSDMYLVTFSWFVLPVTWTADGAPALVGLKTSQVNQLCGHDHVIGFRTIQDQDASRLLNNYAIITVGTAGGSIQNENGSADMPVRMDQLGTPLPFAVADALWKPLAALGAV